MFNQGFYTPYGMSMPQMMPYASLGRGIGSLGSGATLNQGMGLMSKLGRSASALKGVNWGGLLNNASRALGVVNQAIPLVKQAGPMFNNMKSMLRVARAFKDETDGNTINNNGSKNDAINNEQVSKQDANNSNTISSNSQNPNFFI